MTETELTPSLTRRIIGLPREARVICAGMFINKFGNFLSVFLVLYLTHRGYSPFLAGAALGTIGFGGFLGNAVGGTVADRIGRRWTIVVSMFGTAVFTLLVPLADDIGPIIALSLAVGFLAQLYRPAAGAILVDTVPARDLIAAVSLLRLAMNLGMAVGSVVGGVLSVMSYTYLFVGNAVTCLLFGLLVLALLPETRPGSSREAGTTPRGGYRTVFRDRAMVLYLMSMFAATYVYVQTTATLPLHVRQQGDGNEFYGVLLGVNALLIVLFELPLVRFTERRPPRHVIALGVVLLGAGVALTGVANAQGALVATVVLWTLGEMIYTPVATAYPGLLAPDYLRGRYQGAEGVAVTVAQTAGPAAGGFLYGHTAIGHWVLCGVIAVLGAAFMLAAKPAGAAT
ncbi:MFS transporter [Streptosporangium sp. NPDC051023]|uniref:MDR family MFS transporter n=1 Tax=Streptosporangium sp. NPDC051023 TaxID=3155410 RepID=UPI00344DEB83